MLRQRMMTALVGIGVLGIAITYGGWILIALVTLLAAIAWGEYTRLMHRLHYRMWQPWGWLVFFLGGLGLGLGIQTAPLIALLLGISLLILFYLMHVLRFVDVAIHAIGGLYIGAGFGSWLLLGLPSSVSTQPIGTPLVPTGSMLLWLVFLCVWASDTCAFFVGRALGRHRIVPTISPNKTKEGYIGGFLGCLLIGWIAGILLGFPGYNALHIAALVGVVAPIGDLFESKLKRDAGLKDSGRILPGHGGVLDRFDSLLLSFPVVVAYLFLL